ncbi:MAG TPA: hypothetical protein VGX50_01200, partial [Longimicrobium sp.]|nr:hypothetical protein [Longimicrobium sp.]
MLAIVGFLAPTDLITRRAERLHGLVGRYGATPSIHVYSPWEHAIFTPGSQVSLSAYVDMPGQPTTWVSATFYVDGTAVTASTSGNSMSGYWDSTGATNPSEHRVYATATVTDYDGTQYNLDSRNASPDGDGRSILFAVADVYLRRAEFTNSHPMYYDGDSYGTEFSVPSSCSGPDSRPHWELKSGAYGPYEQGTYELCRAMSQTASLTLNTNVGSASSPSLREVVDGSLGAWPSGWHTTISLGSGGSGTATTPALSEEIDEQWMMLDTHTELGFSDGYWSWLSARSLYVTTYTDAGPQDPDASASADETYETPGPQEDSGESPPPLITTAQRPGTIRALAGQAPGGRMPLPAQQHAARFRALAVNWARGLRAPNANIARKLAYRLYGFNDAGNVYNAATAKIRYNPNQNAFWMKWAFNAAGQRTRVDFSVKAFLASTAGGARPFAVCADY